MKTKNIGVVGAGFMGKAHCVALSNMPKLFTDAPYVPVFKTVCDIVPEIAEDFKERFSFEKACTDYMDIINDPDIDIVCVCTPNDSHAEISIAALKAGKHVVCEKPIAAKTEDAKAMAEAAEEAAKKGIVSMCGYQYRRVPAIDEAKKIIESGRLGEITNIRAQYLQSWSADPRSPLSWRFVKETAGAGTLGDIFTHALDIAQYLAGNVTDVVSMVKTYINERPVQEGGVDLLGTVKLGDDAKKQVVDVDDEVSVLCKFDSGAIGSVEATRMAWGRNNYLTVEVHGTKGSLTWNYERLNELEVCYGMEDNDGERGFRKIYTGPANPHGDVTWNIPGMNIGYGELKAIEAYEFAKAVEGGYQPTTSFTVGYQLDRVCEAVLESNEKKAWVEVK
ncbi:MAG: gfo/Idh/MocA family oxidoreductase [Lachnospiraceae bacterium]|nr:MAG: gfo/Idh/MocA family oxidoreductase [Lachnospiraceae bacterium]